jgi:hypothetical protein
MCREVTIVLGLTLEARNQAKNEENQSLEYEFGKSEV